MFSGDDSFDVDDEDFLKLALNVEQQSQEARVQNKTSGSESTYASTENRNKSASVLQKASLRSHDQKSHDPLGLNKVLLNNRQFDENDHSSPETCCSKSTSDLLSPNSDSARAVTGSNDTSSAVNTPGTRIKKFNFKHSTNRSPVDQEVATAGNPPQDDSKTDKSHKENNQSIHNTQSFKSSTKNIDTNFGLRIMHSDVAVLEKVPENGKKNSNLFDFDQDGWDSDLDLSGVDAAESVSWLPGKKLQTDRASSLTSLENNSSSSSKLATPSTKNHVTAKPVLRQSALMKNQIPSVQNLKDIQNANISNSEKHKTKAKEVSSECEVSPRKENCFKAPKDTKFGRFLVSDVGDKCTIDSTTSVSNTTVKSSANSCSTLRPMTPVSRGSNPSMLTVGKVSHTPVTSAERASLASQSSSEICNPIMCSENPSLTTPSSSKTQTKVISAERASLMTPSSSKSSVCSSGKRKRKFPGPAGVLPKLRPGVGLDEMNAYKPASPRVTSVTKQVQAPPDSQMANSQTIEDRFMDGPWAQMLDDLEPQAQAILQEYSIANVLNKAQRKALPRSKVPVLCVLVTDISLQTSEASVLLRDKTGEMKGTVHRSVIKEYPDELHIGAVLVLRQVGVFSPSGRTFYLNVTPNNLVRMYSRGTDSSQGVVAKQITHFCNEDFKMPEPISTPQTPQPVGRHPGKNSLRTPHQSPALFRQARPQLWSPGSRGPTPQRFSGGNPSFRTSTPYRMGISQLRGPLTPRTGSSHLRGNTPQRMGPVVSGIKPPEPRPNSSVIHARQGPEHKHSLSSIAFTNSNSMQPNSNRFSFRPIQRPSPKSATVAPAGSSTSTRTATVMSHKTENYQGSVICGDPAADTGLQDDQLDDLLRDIDDDMMMDM